MQYLHPLLTHHCSEIMEKKESFVKNQVKKVGGNTSEQTGNKQIIVNRYSTKWLTMTKSCGRAGKFKIQQKKKEF